MLSFEMRRFTNGCRLGLEVTCSVEVDASVVVVVVVGTGSSGLGSITGNSTETEGTIAESEVVLGTRVISGDGETKIGVTRGSR